MLAKNFWPLYFALGALCCNGRLYYGAPDAGSEAGGRAASSGTLAGDAAAIEPCDDNAVIYGTPEVLVANTDGAADIALDATYVYWTGGSEIMKVPLNGGTPITLASGQNQPHDIAVDANYAYWTSVTSSGFPGFIMKVPLDGGTPITLASVTCLPMGLKVNATSVFFMCDTLATAWGTGVDTNYVMSVPRQGGTPTTLVAEEGYALDLAIDGANIYWSHGPPSYVSNGETVSPIDGRLEKAPLGGGAQATLASGLWQPDSIVVDGATLFWTDFMSSVVMSIPIEGGVPTTLASLSAAGSWGIAVDASSVYYADREQGTVMKVCRGGGEPKTLATGQDVPHSVAVDATSIYWLNGLYSNEGQVMKLRLH